MLYLGAEKVCISGFVEVLSSQKNFGLQIVNPKITNLHITKIGSANRKSAKFYIYGRLAKLINYLKVHKIEIFFGFHFEICIISLLLCENIKILQKKFLIRPLLGEIRFFRLV